MKKRLLIWILTIAILLTSLPLCASAADTSDAYAAYLNVLKSNRSQITEYQNWQSSDDHKCGVALCDICGDDTPELLFCTVEAGFASRLHIYTYEDSRAGEIYNEYFEVLAAAGSRACLFQTAGDKSLCFYHSIGDGEEEWEYSFTRFTYSGGKLIPKTKYTHVRHMTYRNNMPAGYRHTYSCNDSAISAAAYDSKTTEMRNAMQTVFFKARLMRDDTALLQKANGAVQLAVPLDTAIAFFSGSKKIPFLDAEDTAYYADAVNWAVKEGITTGLNAMCFGPDRTCTRAQVVTFLWRACGSPTPESSHNPFTDVKAGQYYHDAVLWAVEQGITTGISATQFGTDRPCTRGQVVTFLWRAKGSPEISGKQNPYLDITAAQYYYTPVLWAVGQKITNGKTTTAFAPEQVCTRAQIVTFLYRTYQ